MIPRVLRSLPRIDRLPLRLRVRCAFANAHDVEHEVRTTRMHARFHARALPPRKFLPGISMNSYEAQGKPWELLGGSKEFPRIH